MLTSRENIVNNRQNFWFNLLTFCILLCGTNASYAKDFNGIQASLDDSEIEIQEFANQPKPRQSSRQLGTEKKYIVELKEASLAESRLISNNNDQANSLTRKVLSGFQKKMISNQQSSFINTLQSRSADIKIEGRLNTLINAVIVSSSDLDESQLSEFVDVKRVYKEEYYYPQLDASLDHIKAPELWQRVGGKELAGKDIRIAILDTGINPNHPMFVSTMPVDKQNLPTDDYCNTTDSNFCQGKIVLARWYRPSFSICQQENLSPLDFDGHGTFVAGISAGSEVNTSIRDIDITISGVAPAASLMIYKVLFRIDDCQATSATNIELVQALDDAVKDGANIINNSWGGGPGSSPVTSVYRTLFDNAERAGVILVSAVGNDGKSQSINCPACIESGIGVANTTTGRFFANTISLLNQNILALAALNTAPLTSDINSSFRVAANVDASNADGCQSFASNTFRNQVAVVRRGNCLFSTKVINAANAGATALVIYNNVKGSPPLLSIPSARIPVFAISQSDGNKLLSNLNSQITINAKVTRQSIDKFKDFVSRSSSLGPNGDQSFLKPDISAPGTLIASANTNFSQGEIIDIATGTSFSSPHIAGAAAVMKQLRPSWSPQNIKTALMSTSKIYGITNESNQQSADAFSMGAGRVNLAEASRAVLTFDKGSLVNENCVSSCIFDLMVTNQDSVSNTWSIDTQITGAQLSVLPQNISLMPNQTQQLRVTVDTNNSAINSWIFGNIFLRNNQQEAHIPLVILAKDSTDTDMLSIVKRSANTDVSEPFSVTSRLVNDAYQEPLTLLVKLPESTQFTDLADISIDINKGQEDSRDIDLDKGQISWTGRLDKTQYLAQKSANIALDTPFDLGSSPIECDSDCNEVSAVINTPTFSYNNKLYQQVTISDNGLILLGNQLGFDTRANKRLPDNTVPNNILAPLWADYDLKGTAANDEGNGSIYIDTVQLSTATGEVTNYIVVQWQDVEVAGDISGNRNSFSVWLRIGNVEEVFFYYSNISTLPNNVTIGVENDKGTNGLSYKYNNEGDTVVSDDMLTITRDIGGSVDVNYQAKVTETKLALSRSISLAEDGQSSFNVLQNADAGVDHRTVTADLVVNNTVVARAQQQISMAGVGDLGEVELAKMPEHGELSLSVTGEASYRPEKGFFGADSFSYRVQDNSGLPSADIQVDLSVIPLNSAIFLEDLDTQAEAGDFVNLAINVRDLVQNSLSFNWTQTLGTPVNFSQSANSINFTMPQTQGDLLFTVVATDGNRQSNIATVRVRSVVQLRQGTSGSGADSWQSIILLIFIYVIRRRFGLFSQRL